jgi:hypothetical protein
MKTQRLLLLNSWRFVYVIKRSLILFGNNDIVFYHSQELTLQYTQNGEHKVCVWDCWLSVQSEKKNLRTKINYWAEQRFFRGLKRNICRRRTIIEQRKFEWNNRWFLKKQNNYPLKPNHNNARFSQNLYAAPFNLEGIQRPQKTRDWRSIWDTVGFTFIKLISFTSSIFATYCVNSAAIV